MDGNNIKYVLGTTKYKTTIEKEDDIHDPRITKTSVSWDNNMVRKLYWMK